MMGYSDIKKEFDEMFLDSCIDDLPIFGSGRATHEKDCADMIKYDKPIHYDIGIDTFTRMRANATYEEAMGFIRWNIDKYNTRKKNQDEEDYKKISDYCKEALWWFQNKRSE